MTTQKDEIDLLELFRRMGQKIGQLFTGLLRFIFLTILFFWRNSLILLAFVVFGGLVGFGISKLAKPFYSSDMIAQINATKYLSILAQVSAVAYSGDNYIEYKSILRIKPFRYLNLDVGYKATKVDYSHSSDVLDLDVKGPFIQGSFVYKF